MSVRPSKTRISLGILPVWSESSLRAKWVAKDPMFLKADSEDSDQTGRMPRLIWVFAGRTCHFVDLSWGGSNNNADRPYLVFPEVKHANIYFGLNKRLVENFADQSSVTPLG